ncbi:Mei1p [Mactra antiquata]
MDFIVKDVHTEHDGSWLLYSAVHDCPVCLGCIIETVENTELLPLQRKPALTEFQRLLQHQQSDVLQLFMQEENIVWHLLNVLLDSLSLKDEGYVAMCIEVLLKIIQVVGSDDLVTTVLDKISNQVWVQVNGSPEFRQEDSDLLLYGLSMDLCNGGEVIQSAVAYIFIFLCDVNQIDRLSTRIMQQLHSGIILMLSSAQSLPVQINGLGLLKKLLLNDESCQILMALNNQQMTLLSCLKKLLLGKKDIIQTGVSQILWLILKKENYNVYATEILHSDIVGVESILRALICSIEMKHPYLLKSGCNLLTDILNRHPDDVPLFLSGTVVKKCLCVIQHGIEHHQTAIFSSAQDTFTAILRRKYLLSPVPFLQLRDMFSTLLQKKTDHIKLFVHNEKKQHSNGANFFMGVEIFLEQIIKCCQLITECKDDLTACENNYSAPGSENSTPSYDSFISILVDSFSLICSLMTMKFWDLIKREQYYIKFLEAMCSVNNINCNVVSSFCYKLVSAGVINGLVDAKVKYSSTQLSNLTGRLLQFVSEISYAESFLTTEFMALEVNADYFQWSLAVVPRVFSEQKIDVKSVESYLWIIFLSYKFDHCIYSEEEMVILLSAITNQHTLMELSPIARKHMIFLLAYLGTQCNVDVRHAIPNVLQGLPTVLQDTDTIWYTHDTTLLEWIFSDPVLAGTCGQIVIEIFMNNSSLDTLQELYGSGRYNKTDVINQLGHSKTFIGSMIKNMAMCNGESVSKYSVILESYILHMNEKKHEQQEEDSMLIMQELMSDNSNPVVCNHLSWILDQVTAVLQDIFLKNYPQSNGTLTFILDYKLEFDNM